MTPITANAQPLQPLPRASESQPAPATGDANPTGGFAALMEFFTDAVQTSEPKHRFTKKEEKQEEPEQTSEPDFSNLPPTAGIPVGNLQNQTLPFNFAWPLNPAATNEEGDSTKQLGDNQIAAGRPVFPNAEPLLPPVPVEPASQDLEKPLPAAEPVEVLAALTLRDTAKTIGAPKGKLAFEARLRQDTSKTNGPATPVQLDNKEISKEPHKSSVLQPNSEPSDSKKGAAVATAPDRKQAPSLPETQSGETAKPLETKLKTPIDQPVNGAHQESHAIDAAERKTSAIEAAIQSNVRHTAEPAAASQAQQNSKQPDTVKSAEKPLAAASPQTDIPESAPARTEPIRDISFRMASDSAQAIDIRLTESSGQIRVAVHAADPVLTSSLQSNVSELAGKLERAGFHTETVLPIRPETAGQAQSTPNFQDSPKDRKAPQYEAPRPKKQVRSAETDFQIDMLHTTFNRHQEKS